MIETNPWDKYVAKWDADPRGMVAASMDAWKESEFPTDWLASLHGVVMELGPGGGRQTALLCKRCSVDVADLSSVIVDKVKERLSVREGFVLPRSGELPNRPGRYDAFVASYVFCHCSIHDIWLYLKGASALLRPDGVAVFDAQVVNAENWSTYMEKYLKPGRVGTGPFAIQPLSDFMVRALCLSVGLHMERSRCYSLCMTAYWARKRAN